MPGAKPSLVVAGAVVLFTAQLFEQIGSIESSHIGHLLVPGGGWLGASGVCGLGRSRWNPRWGVIGEEHIAQEVVHQVVDGGVLEDQ